MTGIPSGGGIGASLSIGPALAKLRRDKALSNEVHDPSEDEPRIVGIPKRYQPPVEARQTRTSGRHAPFDRDGPFGGGPSSEETLAEQIGLAVAAVLGPSHVVLEWAGEHVVRSGISHGAGQDDPPESTTSFAFERSLWWAKGKHFRREILYFSAIPDVESNDLICRCRGGRSCR